MSELCVMCTRCVIKTKGKAGKALDLSGVSVAASGELCKILLFGNCKINGEFTMPKGLMSIMFIFWRFSSA